MSHKLSAITLSEPGNRRALVQSHAQVYLSGVPKFGKSNTWVIISLFEVTSICYGTTCVDSWACLQKVNEGVPRL